MYCLCRITCASECFGNVPKGIARLCTRRNNKSMPASLQSRYRKRKIGILRNSHDVLNTLATKGLSVKSSIFALRNSPKALWGSPKVV